MFKKLNRFKWLIWTLIWLFLPNLTFSALSANQSWKSFVNENNLKQMSDLNGKTVLEAKDHFYYPIEYFQFGVQGVEMGDRFAYTQQLSRQVTNELKSLVLRLQHSIDIEKYPCESYYDYVCGLQQPLFTILGKEIIIDQKYPPLIDLC